MDEKHSLLSQEAAWKCPGCGEQNPAEFDVCWNCGCSVEGKPDPAFRQVDEIDSLGIPARDPEAEVLPYPPLKKQFSLAFLLGVVTLSAILAAMLRTRVGWGILAILAAAILIALVLICIQAALLFLVIYGGGFVKDLFGSNSESDSPEAFDRDRE